MGAYLIVRKDPYAAVSDKDGTFTIKDLPAGKELEFVLWQEKPGYLKNATFKGGKADARGRFKYQAQAGRQRPGRHQGQRFDVQVAVEDRQGLRRRCARTPRRPRDGESR